MLIKETADDAGQVRTVAIMVEGRFIAASFEQHKEVGGRCHIWFGVEDGRRTLPHHTATLAYSEGPHIFDAVSMNMAWDTKRVYPWAVIAVRKSQHFG